MIIVESIALCFGTLGLLLFVCEIGHQFGRAFNEVDEVFMQINFYLLPLELQRILPMTIMYLQEPPVVRFFGSSSCTRKQFKKASATNLTNDQFTSANLKLFAFQMLGHQNRLPIFYDSS